MEQIAAMEVTTLFLRATYRDYYDLYYLPKSGYLSIEKLFEYTARVIPGLTMKLFFMALLYIDDIQNEDIVHLNPKQAITKKGYNPFSREK